MARWAPGEPEPNITLLARAAAMKYEGPPRTRNLLVDPGLNISGAEAETYSRLMGLSDLYVDAYRPQSSALVWARSESLPEWSQPDAIVSGNGMAMTAVKVGYADSKDGLERFVNECIQKELALWIY